MRDQLWFSVSAHDQRLDQYLLGNYNPDGTQVLDDNLMWTTSAKVSWQVTGIRHDAYANAHPVNVEQDKSASEKGKYQNPTEYGQPASLGVDYEQQQKMQQKMQRLFLSMR